MTAAIDLDKLSGIVDAYLLVATSHRCAVLRKAFIESGQCPFVISKKFRDKVIRCIGKWYTVRAFHVSPNIYVARYNSSYPVWLKETQHFIDQQNKMSVVLAVPPLTRGLWKILVNSRTLYGFPEFYNQQYVTYAMENVWYSFVYYLAVYLDNNGYDVLK